MFRPFIGSSSGPPEIISKKLFLFYLHYGIPHAYGVRYIKHNFIYLTVKIYKTQFYISHGVRYTKYNFIYLTG